MTRRLVASLAAVGLAVGLLSATSVADASTSTGTNRNLVQVASSDPQFSTLVQLVTSAGLASTLSSGNYTVFAPTNAAFAKLPAGTVESLLKPENKSTLTKVLTYHVVAGKWDADALMQLVRKGNGSAELSTVSGGKLWVVMNGQRNLVVKDEKGMWSEISTYDVMQSNGVIHVVTSVLMPR